MLSFLPRASGIVHIVNSQQRQQSPCVHRMNSALPRSRAVPTSPLHDPEICNSIRVSACVAEVVVEVFASDNISS
jgi:hypothetical protein